MQFRNAKYNKSEALINSSNLANKSVEFLYLYKFLIADEPILCFAMLLKGRVHQAVSPMFTFFRV